MPAQAPLVSVGSASSLTKVCLGLQPSLFQHWHNVLRPRGKWIPAPKEACLGCLRWHNVEVNVSPMLGWWSLIMCRVLPNYLSTHYLNTRLNGALKNSTIQSPPLGQCKLINRLAHAGMPNQPFSEATITNRHQSIKCLPNPLPRPTVLRDRPFKHTNSLRSKDFKLL